MIQYNKANYILIQILHILRHKVFFFSAEMILKRLDLCDLLEEELVLIAKQKAASSSVPSPNQQDSLSTAETPLANHNTSFHSNSTPPANKDVAKEKFPTADSSNGKQCNRRTRDSGESTSNTKNNFHDGENNQSLLLNSSNLSDMLNFSTDETDLSHEHLPPPGVKMTSTQKDCQPNSMKSTKENGQSISCVSSQFVQSPIVSPVFQNDTITRNKSSELKAGGDDDFLDSIDRESKLKYTTKHNKQQTSASKLKAKFDSFKYNNSRNKMNLHKKLNDNQAVDKMSGSESERHQKKTREKPDATAEESNIDKKEGKSEKTGIGDANKNVKISQKTISKLKQFSFDHSLSNCGSDTHNKNYSDSVAAQMEQRSENVQSKCDGISKINVSQTSTDKQKLKQTNSSSSANRDRSQSKKSSQLSSPSWLTVLNSKRPSPVFSAASLDISDADLDLDIPLHPPKKSRTG